MRAELAQTLCPVFTKAKGELCSFARANCGCSRNRYTQHSLGCVALRATLRVRLRNDQVVRSDIERSRQFAYGAEPRLVNSSLDPIDRPDRHSDPEGQLFLGQQTPLPPLLQ